MFHSISIFKQNTHIERLKSYSREKRGGREGGCCQGNQSRAGRHHEASSALCVYVCGHSACEFTLLSPDRRRGHPPLTLCQQREEERETHTAEGERERLKPHNALHAAGLKSCRFISSCSEGLCVSSHSLIHQDRVQEKHTDNLAGKAAFLCPLDGFWVYKIICFVCLLLPLRGGEGRVASSRRQGVINI